jgi:hypothetical protein
MVAVSLSAVASTAASQYGTADEVKAMLDRAIAAVKENEARALDLQQGRGIRTATFTFRALTASSQRLRPSRVDS